LQIQVKPYTHRGFQQPTMRVRAATSRWSQAQGSRHKALTDWSRLAILQTKRWLPDRRLVVVADVGFSALKSSPR
jgi:hypothetical protein